LGEMNPDQLEVVIKHGNEYLIEYPQDMTTVDLVVSNTEIRKQLMKTSLNLKNLIN